MDKSEHIPIPRKPSPYRPRLSLDRPSYGWRAFSYFLLGCAVITWLIYFAMRKG